MILRVRGGGAEDVLHERFQGPTKIKNIRVNQKVDAILKLHDKINREVLMCDIMCVQGTRNYKVRCRDPNSMIAISRNDML